MSYDLHCYRSALGHPSVEGAEEMIEAEELDESTKASNPQVVRALAVALRTQNPRLETNGEYDGEDVLELITPDGDLATTITISSDAVGLSVPYWYDDERASEVFRQVEDYTKVIRTTAGFFVYDGQIGEAYDPLETPFPGLDVYLSTTRSFTSRSREVEDAPSADGISVETGERAKPWWKFW